MKLKEILKVIKLDFLENFSDKEIKQDYIFSGVGISSGFKTEKISIIKKKYLSDTYSLREEKVDKGKKKFVRSVL